MSPENENENEEQESSNIPDPEANAEEQGFDASDTEESDQEPSEEQMILDDLKNRAKQLGITFHPSIGIPKLREKIQEALASDNTQPATEKPVAIKKDDTGRASKKAAALKLIRVNIGCLDPLKKAHQGDWFITGNSVIGTVKRFVPFNVDWHVPQIILNMIREKEFLSITTSRDDKGFEIINKRLTKTYTVSLLEPLSEQELKELAQRQALARGEAA